MINWIDVKDRLPPDEKDVLVASKDCPRGFSIGYFCRNNKWVESIGYITVTHWAEVNLPEA